MADEARTTPTITADVDAARRRSELYGIDPTTTDVPHRGDPGPSAEALAQLSSPVLDQLLGHIVDSSLAVVMADRDGRLTRRDAPERRILTTMDSRSLDIGYSLAESDVGTNGVGTSIETKRPAMIVGDGHFLEGFHGFTCANAPIVQPVTGRLEGTVGVVCPVADTGPLLLSTAVRLADQIGGLLLEQATQEERFLLEQFLLHRASPKNAVATIGRQVLIATPPAQRHLADIDHDELWSRVELALQGGNVADLELDRPDAAPLVLRCLPLHRGGELEGAAVHVVARRNSTDRGRRHRPSDRLGALVGVSQQWQAVVRDALGAAQFDEPVLVIGERGAGRRAVADAVAARSVRPTLQVADGADVLVDGPTRWLGDVADAAESDSTLVLRRVDELPDDVAASLAKLVEAPCRARFIATSRLTTSDRPGLDRLLRHLDVLRVEIPPLRERRDDIPVLARHFAASFGRSSLERPVLAALGRQRWPGNAAELAQAIRSAHVAARGGPLTVDHLPRHLRHDHARTPLHGLRQQEAEAIMAAIDSTATRAEAARLLGISRATLYRRIEAYGLDV
ncbi:MAG: helix-turn-helix domain-containing protein [Actinomycetota bacterium]